MSSMRTHLLVVNHLGETVVDEDVNDVEVANGKVTWWNWEKGAKDQKDEHELSLSDLGVGDQVKVELSRCSDRLKSE